MKRKYRTIIVSYAAAGAAILGGLAASYHAEAELLRREVTGNYRHAFSEVVSGVSGIDAALQKSLCASSPELLAAVCMEVFGESVSAQMAMGSLPLSDYDLGETASFVARVGDYAYMLSRSAACGDSCTEEQRKNLEALSSAATKLSQSLNAMLADVDDGAVSISSPSAAEAAGTASSLLGDSIQSMESEFPEIPSLIYDGPFSEHISQMEPLMLKGAEEIGPDAAVSAAARFTGLRESVFRVAGERGGTVPAYMLYAAVDGGELSVEVSERGGAVVSMLSSRQVQSASVTADEAAGIAADYLAARGYGDMRESYHMTENNICTVNFAYTQGDIICYPDLIKVAVALDNGSVVGFEALGYIMSHTERDIPEAEVSEEQAAEKVSSTLEILAHELAVIPTEGKYEVFCHEFKCGMPDGRHCIVYVNAVTGAEEKILLLLESENGTLTI